jgi:hypothetical protein
MSDDRVTLVAELLHEAAETHHIVYRISDGDDPDWATWYSKWLLNLSELPEVLARKPVQSHLIYELVRLDREYTASVADETWEHAYARSLISVFG